jgi:hypothetical protein
MDKILVIAQILEGQVKKSTNSAVTFEPGSPLS